MCGQQTVHVLVSSFTATSDVLPPNQAEEAVVEANFLQLAPRMFMGIGEEKTERKDTLIASIDATLQHGEASGWLFEMVTRIGAKAELWSLSASFVRRPPLREYSV